MAATRYAPEDPTLLKPWKGLIDGKTGYLYFWNPETNITQYERPIASSTPGPGPLLPNPLKSTSVAISSSAQVRQSSVSFGHGHQRDSNEDGRYNGSQSHQHLGTRGANAHLQTHPNGSANGGHGASNVNSQGHTAQNPRSSAGGHGSSAMECGLSGESYCRHHEITVTGDDIPAPFVTFVSTGFPSEILREVHLAGFSSPTPIQAQSWPIALQGRDIVSIAKTGSGKTLGYLIPGFTHLKGLRNNSQLGPTVLVLSPTRELATQILVEAVKFGRSSRISCTCLYGGAPKGPQLRDLDRGADVVVATPGRLNDILEMRRVSLRQVSYLVLDEADRMLDMGFEPQIRKIVKEIPAHRQTLMFTATWPKEVCKIAADLLVNPVHVNIGSIDKLVANKAITQYVEVMRPMEKQRRLEQILQSQVPGSKVIVFCSTKRMCDQLARSLARQFGASAMHGDKSQGERDYVLSQFRTGKSPILVATDVAARGLDVKDIRVVINYDFPTGIEDYVHRIGRTGRAGATGESYTFFCDQDAKYASDIIKVLEGTNQRVPPEIRGMVSRGGGYGKFRRWGSSSGGRDGGRAGGGQIDSGYGGRGGWGPPASSGRSESNRGDRGLSDRDPPLDRYERGYHAAHEVDTRGPYDSQGIWGNGDHKAGDKDLGRIHSRSRSPGPNRCYGGLGNSQSRSHGRSRSRSPSRSLNKHVAGVQAGGLSVATKRRDTPPVNCGTADHTAHYQQQPEISPYSGDNGIDNHFGRSPNTRRDKSQSPNMSIHNERAGTVSLEEQQWKSPHYGGGDEAPTFGSVCSPPLPNPAEEVEEGMIPPDDDGMNYPDAGRNSPGIPILD